MTPTEFARKYDGLSTSAAVALIRFSQTPDGKRFMDGAPLKPQFTEPKKTNPRRMGRGPRRRPRRVDVTLDWIDDE